MKRLIAFSYLVAAAFAFQASQKNTSGVTIQGKVLQEPGGQPIRKANVQFSARDGQSNGQYSDTTDAALLLYEHIWAAAGTPFAVFAVSPEDLQRVTGAVVEDVK